MGIGARRAPKKNFLGVRRDPEGGGILFFSGGMFSKGGFCFPNKECHKEEYNIFLFDNGGLFPRKVENIFWECSRKGDFIFPIKGYHKE